MRYLMLVICVSLLSTNCVSQEFFGSLHFGQASINHNNYNQTLTGQAGIGLRINRFSLELSYIDFTDFETKQSSDAYIELHGTQLTAKYQIHAGNYHPFAGLSTGYYTASAYHAGSQVARSYDYSPGAVVGVEYSLSPSLLFVLKGDYVNDLLGRDLQNLSFGIQKEW